MYEGAKKGDIGGGGGEQESGVLWRDITER